MIITGKTRLLGVIGHPIEHSLSPKMHNAALNHLQLDYIYLPFNIPPEKLTQAIAGFEAISLVGFNVTIPHKQAIMPLLQHMSQLAQTVGAVNTVWWNGSGWQGTNTDIAGFLSPLLLLQRDWPNITPVILGHGGAARAVIVGCAELGCPAIHVVGRNLDKLSHFKASWLSTGLETQIYTHSWDKIESLLSQTELLINTTPLGMEPLTHISPVEEAFWDKIKPGLIAYDLIYTPSPTLFLQQAAQRGAHIIDGREMLIQQGAAAFKIWLGKDAPLEVMREAMAVSKK